jgi:PTS system mannose-specific IIA component
MSVALVLVTHGEIGKYIHEAATSIIGSSPLRVQFLSINAQTQPEVMVRKAQEMVGSLDTGDGVLILTDMYGATPSNVACALQQQNVEVIAGLNLPMIVRIMNYPNLPLHRLADKAVSGGKEGVMFFQTVSTSDATREH